ncbi:MAG: excinuclease ABC subunit UvrA, partial [Deltaproteobacteria bacterium]
VSIDQKATSRNPRSTVGTVTEVYDYLRLLYARIGIPHCPVCGKEVVKQSAQEIVDIIASYSPKSKLLILAPIIRGRKGTYQSVFEEIRKAGFVRVRVDGKMVSLDEKIDLDRYKIHDIEAVVDRIVVPEGQDEKDQQAFISRLTDSVETSLKFGEGYLIVHNLSASPPTDSFFSESLACSEHGVSMPEIEPRNFSFNTPHGACPKCQGLGFRQEIDPNLLIPDKTLSLNDGAISAMEWNDSRENRKYYWQMLSAAAKVYKISLKKPIMELTEEQLDIILYGSKGVEIEMDLQGRTHRHILKTKWEGVITNLMRRYRDTHSEYIRTKIAEFMNDSPCPTCNGERLRPESLAVTIDDKNIMEVTNWPVERTLPWIQTFMEENSPLNKRDQAIANQVLKEIRDRLEFLVNVGLDYLSLKRSAATLSGGEAQRIRLATQVGSRLMGVLYVQDEPSIGLHARDNARLLATLEGLRDQGNTVIVVEHDEETIRKADWIVDLGPGAGEHGGEIVAEGTVDAIIAHPSSITGAYLDRRLTVPIPEKRRNGNGMHLEVIGAKANNLKNIDVDLPRDKLIVITGLSGSGKSSLAFDTLYAEGQRRYVETFSPHARQFLDRMPKPDADRISNIPPAIALRQRPRS